MIWVLIIYMSLNNGWEVNIQKFNSEEACKQVGEEVVSINPKLGFNQSRAFTYKCIGVKDTK